MKKLIASGLIAIAAVVGQPLSAAKTAKVEGIYSGVNACLDATSLAGVSATLLMENGWRPGTISADDKQIATDLRFYGSTSKANEGVVLMALDDKPICTITARIDRFSMIDNLIHAVSTKRENKPPVQSEGDYYWISKEVIIQMAATGSRSKPSVRIVIMAQEEKE